METWIQWAGGLAFVSLSGLVGYMINQHNRLREDVANDNAGMNARIEEIKRDYVRRDDFKEFRETVKESLQRIEDKQDRLINLSRSH